MWQSHRDLRARGQQFVHSAGDVVVLKLICYSDSKDRISLDVLVRENAPEERSKFWLLRDEIGHHTRLIFCHDAQQLVD
jgi:hypothetical protein